MKITVHFRHPNADGSTGVDVEDTHPFEALKRLETAQPDSVLRFMSFNTSHYIPVNNIAYVETTHGESTGSIPELLRAVRLAVAHDNPKVTVQTVLWIAREIGGYSLEIIFHDADGKKQNVTISHGNTGHSEQELRTVYEQIILRNRIDLPIRQTEK